MWTYIIKLSVINIGFSKGISSWKCDFVFLVQKTALCEFDVHQAYLFGRCIGYFEQYVEYDPFFTAPELPNPWTSDNPEFWEQEKIA
jgi:hypothetical protein